MLSSQQSSSKIQDGSSNNGSQVNQPNQKQSNSQMLRQKSLISNDKNKNSQIEKVQTQQISGEVNQQTNKNESENQNSNMNNQILQVNSGNCSDDEIQINPELEKFFKRREFMDQINRPMLRSDQDRNSDQNDSNEDGAQLSVSNQRRALKQIGLIKKQEQNNVQAKLTKLKRYSDKLSNTIKCLQAWEEPQNNIGVGKTLDEKFEIAESMLHRWQDLGLVDGPVTKKMMMKYPEYEQLIQNEKNLKNRMPLQNYKDKCHKIQENNNNMYSEDQDESTARNNIKIRISRDGSANPKNKFIIKDHVRSIQQSPRLNTEKTTQNEQQSQYLPNDMLATQNNFRKPSQQNPKHHSNMIDEQIIRNLNETKYLEDQKNLIMNNNLNSQKSQYQQSCAQPIHQYGSNASEYRKQPIINNFNNGNTSLNRPRLKTPKRGEKLNSPIDYNETNSNEIEKQYRMRYSSAEPPQNELFEVGSSGNGYSKLGNQLNNTQHFRMKNENYESNENNHRFGDDNEISSLFPQIHNYSENFRLSGGKLRNSFLQQRVETPKKRTNYGSSAYPHGSYLSYLPNGSTPKYQQ